MNTEPKLAPGPWKWGVDGDDPERGGTPLFDANGKAVMNVYESHGGGKMPEGVNKSAIEALPDLLAALEAAKRDYESPHQDGRLRGSTFETILAAINKAEGNT